MDGWIDGLYIYNIYMTISYQTDTDTRFFALHSIANGTQRHLEDEKKEGLGAFLRLVGDELRLQLLNRRENLRRGTIAGAIKEPIEGASAVKVGCCHGAVGKNSKRLSKCHLYFICIVSRWSPCCVYLSVTDSEQSDWKIQCLRVLIEAETCSHRGFTVERPFK